MDKGLGVLILVYMCIAMVAWTFGIAFGRLLVLRKAGKPAWSAFVPFYGTYEIYALSWDISLFWVRVLMLAICVFGFIAGGNAGYLAGGAAGAYAAIGIIDAYYLAKAFGHGFLCTLALLLAYPFACIFLGWGKSTYLGPKGDETNA